MNKLRLFCLIYKSCKSNFFTANWCQLEASYWLLACLMGLTSQLPLTSILICVSASCKTMLPIGRCFLFPYSLLIGCSSLFPIQFKIVSTKWLRPNGLRFRFYCSSTPLKPIEELSDPLIGWKRLEIHGLAKPVEFQLTISTAPPVFRLNSCGALQSCNLAPLVWLSNATHLPAEVDSHCVVLDLLLSHASAMFGSLLTRCWVDVEPFLILWVTAVLLCFGCFQSKQQTSKGCSSPNGSVQWVNRFFALLHSFISLYYWLINSQLK